MAYAMLIDLTRCRGCKACVVACKEQNELPADGPDQLSSHTWTAVQNQQGTFVRRQCMHCLDPTCVSVCPVGALQKHASGPVTYDEDRCMGCRYCMVACPFQVPKYEWESALPRVQKCIFCAEKRLKYGQQPACAQVCPTGATTFGQRQAIIREAKSRIETHPNRYIDHVYGIREAGGTSMIYLSSVPFEQLGFPTHIAPEPYPKLTWEILSKIPGVVAIGGTLMLGLWWLAGRKAEVAQGERLQQGEEA